MVRRAALVLLVVSSQPSRRTKVRRPGAKSTRSSPVPAARIATWAPITRQCGLWGAPHGMYISAGESHDNRGRETALTSSLAAPAMASEFAVAARAAGRVGPPKWRLPPSSMQWSGKSSAEICEQVKDPGFNGSRRSVHDLTDHLERAVRWGWAPGPGRKPAPYWVAELVAFLREWDAADRPCPAK